MESHPQPTDGGTGRSTVGRRLFLSGSVGATLALAAGCGNGQTGSDTTAACVSQLTFPKSTAKPRPAEIKSKVPGTPVAWKSYPKPYVTMPDPPGKGGTVTTFQILYSSPPPQNNPWWQEYNKRLGVTIQPTLAASPDYGSKLLTLAASGSFPDLTYINFAAGASGFEKFLTQGAFHDLTSYLTGDSLKQFPNLQTIPALTWKGSSFQGKVFGVPYPIQPVNGQLGMYRKDWAQKLGVDNPKNAQEVMDMFVAFATEDPDGDGKRDTYGLDTLRQGMWMGMFRAPNNWRLKKDGSLEKDMETDEYRAVLEFTHKLWQKGAVYPDALTAGVNKLQTLLHAGKVGFFTQGGWGFFGNQPNTDYTLTKQTDPKANCAPWLPPGHDGGKPGMALGPASWGFGGIPTTIKDEKKIVELIHIMEYCAAPFGSEEFTFMYKGIEGKMFHYVNGSPVGVTGDARNWANGLNYLCGQQEVNYFYANQPGEAQLMQKYQEQQLETAIADPTMGLYSPTWVQNAGPLVQMESDAFQSIAVGNKPMSYLDEVIDTWKKQGGDKARKEFQDALQKCQ
jgi:putative aldouronate transport system substrate-binding protein